MIKTRGRWASYRLPDLAAVAVINLMNVIMVGVFVLRTITAEHSPIFGLVWTAFIVVLVAVVTLNLKTKGQWWTIVLPLLLIVFLVAELILDYIAKYDFRDTSLLVPYLLLYYLSVLGMIGYSFLVERKLGFISLATYFLS